MPESEQYESVKGGISTEYTVWCHENCGESGWVQFSALDAPSKKEAANAARVLGWLFTRKYGWLCPTCAAGLAAKGKQ